MLSKGQRRIAHRQDMEVGRGVKSDNSYNLTFYCILFIICRNDIYYNKPVNYCNNMHKKV